MDIQLSSVPIEKPEEINFILGQSHFIKTVEDIYEAMVNSVPGAKFGVAFCEASADTAIRVDGTDEEMIELARTNALNLSCGHVFIVFMKDSFPINYLRAIKQVPEVCSIFCATANPTDVIVAENQRGRGIMGVIDGNKSAGIESDEQKEWRHGFLRTIGYKK